MNTIQNHKGANFKRCPFNARHFIKSTEYDYHLDHCEDNYNQMHLIQQRSYYCSFILLYTITSIYINFLYYRIQLSLNI